MKNMSEDISYLKASKPRVDSIDEHVSTQLKQKRILLGLSQQEVARALGVSVQQIQKYEAGENRLSSSKLYQIAQSLQAPIEYFFEGLGANQNSVFAEETEIFKFDNQDTPERDIINLISSFKTIADSTVRKHILDLVKSLSKPQ